MIVPLKINWDNGSIRADSLGIALNPLIDLDCSLISKVKELGCDSESKINCPSTMKFSLYGNIADIRILFIKKKIQSLSILFEEIVFFNDSISESRIIRSIQKKLHVQIEYIHATQAKANFLWGEANFYYDPKQGDLSLTLNYDTASTISD